MEMRGRDVVLAVSVLAPDIRSATCMPDDPQHMAAKRRQNKAFLAIFQRCAGSAGGLPPIVAFASAQNRQMAARMAWAPVRQT